MRNDRANRGEAMKYIIALSVLLTGCAAMTPEQRAQALVNKYGPTCNAVGISQGDPRFSECVFYLSRQADRRSAHRGAMGMQLLQMGQPRTLPGPTTTNCYNTTTGVQCTSN